MITAISTLVGFVALDLMILGFLELILKIAEQTLKKNPVEFKLDFTEFKSETREIQVFFLYTLFFLLSCWLVDAVPKAAKLPCGA